MAEKTWREKYVWGRVDVALVLLEIVLSAIFVAIGYFTGNPYFRGVGIGLTIAWVTGALAHFIVGKRG